MPAATSSAAAAAGQQMEELWTSEDVATHIPGGGPTAHILPEERERASFLTESLEPVIAGRRPAAVAEFKPLFEGEEFDASMDDYLSYAELAEKQIGRAAAAIQVIRDNPKLMVTHMAQRVGMADMFDTGSLGIHFIAFLPFLQTQANDAQKAAWLDGALHFEYNGAYAQTELGHGSNVRGLETTATFDADAEEFVINSPTLTSMKWWPTGMYASTHGVVFAQLLVNGTNHGVFGFFMQFRDEHGDLLPGVEIGEIGPKMGGGETNIGYGRFDHVRVPRFNMFSKHAQVTPEGEFVAPPPKLSKFKYIGMMNIRVGMVGGAARAAGQGATIAIRYSCVRRQGFKSSKSDSAMASGENCIMDYKMQQYRLFKALGASYLMTWTGRNIAEFLKKVVDGVEEGGPEAEAAADQLPELHATCAGLKAFCTTWAASLVEDCRKCCGGQGFLRSSGIADLSTSYVSSVTAEGEAVILALQTARYLIKVVNEARLRPDEPVAGSVAYVQDAPLGEVDLADPSADLVATLLALMKDRARAVAADVTEDFNAATAAGADFDEALNSVAVLGWHATECHCMYVMALNAVEAMPKQVEDPAALAALVTLLELVLLQAVKEDAGNFALGRAQQRLAQQLITERLDRVRPDAVVLSDSLGFQDHNLKSTLGRKDGNVYEAIYDEAKRSPLNGRRMVGWEKFSKVLDLDFLRENKKSQRHLPAARL
jgi:acyl-CoA oxidase